VELLKDGGPLLGRRERVELGSVDSSALLRGHALRVMELSQLHAAFEVWVHLKILSNLGFLELPFGTS
jgi:hypothetical protein